MERKVLKRRIKGLAAFVLAVVMMFGSSISALAATTYNVGILSDEEGYSVGYKTDINVGDKLTSEDGIRCSYNGVYLNWEIADDNGTTSSGNIKVSQVVSGATTYFTFLENGKEYEVTESTGATNDVYIKLKPCVSDAGEEEGGGSTGGEEGGSTGESTEDTGSFESTEDTKVEDKDTKKKDEEKKPEEPKESEEQIFNRELLESAAAAKAGDNVTIDATLWHSFSSDVLKELLSKGGVSYTLYYNYEGECFYITLPAGAVLEEGCEWYGPLKLNAMFGRTMIDKKDLHAAIDG